MKDRLQMFCKQCFSLLYIMVFVTMIAHFMLLFDAHSENIMMIYLFGVLVVIIRNKGFIWGILDSILSVFVYNFFFIEPIYSFKMNERNYIFSLLIFFMVSVIVTTLTQRLQKQIQISKDIQQKTDYLYQISSGYLNIKGLEPVIKYGIDSIKLLFPGYCLIYIEDLEHRNYVWYGSEGKVDEEKLDLELKKAAKWCLKNGQQCGDQTLNFTNLKWYCVPIISNKKILAVAVIDNMNVNLVKDDLKLLEGILSQIAVAVDREFANLAEQKIRNLTEREKLRNSLLRSISHDLRTPLAGITGSVSFLLESYDKIDKVNREALLNDILEDSIWLSNMVDNLLNMTRIQECGLLIKKEEEVIDDIISEAVSRIRKRLRNRTLKIERVEELIVVPVDGRLIIQVLINLLDNAIKHTAMDGMIELKVSLVEDKKLYAKIEVIDDGEGIESTILEHMYEDFITTGSLLPDGKRGVGLGLSISKTIVQAHKGIIGGYNNKKGATFYIMLPMKDEVIKDE